MPGQPDAGGATQLLLLPPVDRFHGKYGFDAQLRAQSDADDISHGGELMRDPNEEREARWLHVAEKKGFNCSVCGLVILWHSREIFFERKVCADCDSSWNSGYADD
jgi:hypothetical protein